MWIGGGFSARPFVYFCLTLCLFAFLVFCFARHSQDDLSLQSAAVCTDCIGQRCCVLCELLGEGDLQGFPMFWCCAVCQCACHTQLL